MMGRAAAVFALLALAACASRPVALIALPAAPPAQAAAGNRGATVLVRDTSVPAYLDGFPVVTDRRGSALVVSPDTEWAERPSLGVTRVLREALSDRLGAERVLIAGDGRIPDGDLTVEFLALDPRGSVLHLDARWVFSCTAAGGSRGGRTELDAPMAASTAPAVAAATAAALARFADVLAAATPTGCSHEIGSDRRLVRPSTSAAIR